MDNNIDKRIRALKRSIADFETEFDTLNHTDIKTFTAKQCMVLNSRIEAVQNKLVKAKTRLIELVKEKEEPKTKPIKKSKTIPCYRVYEYNSKFRIRKIYLTTVYSRKELMPIIKQLKADKCIIKVINGRELVTPKNQHYIGLISKEKRELKERYKNRVPYYIYGDKARKKWRVKQFNLKIENERNEYNAKYKANTNG